MADKIVVEIDLSKLWVEGVDGEHGGTVADLIADRAARQLLQESGDSRNAFADRVRRITDEEIREALKPVLVEALGRATQATDRFGTARAEEVVTLSERLVRVAKEELLAPAAGGFHGKRETFLQSFIRQEVQASFGKELREVVQAAKADVMAAVREKAGEVIADTIQRMAEGRSL